MFEVLWVGYWFVIDGFILIVIRIIGRLLCYILNNVLRWGDVFLILWNDIFGIWIFIDRKYWLKEFYVGFNVKICNVWVYRKI